MSYFDGQRDPAEGWATAWNAWRYPTYYTGPATAIPVFTFRPSHTLYIDAALQAQHDADLIQIGDRTHDENIVDTVTHQPISTQPAMKGPDGIFYWDLSAKPPPFTKKKPVGLVQGTAKAEGDLRQAYIEWYQLMADGSKGNDLNVRLLRSKSKTLIGSTTSVKVVSRWERMVKQIQTYQVEKAEKEKSLALAEGEIRVELNSVKLQKNGLIRLGVLNPAAAAGDGLVLVKVEVPTDPMEITETYSMRRGIAKLKPQYSKRSTHDGARKDELWDVLHSPDPEQSLVKFTVVLCNKNGVELTSFDKDGNIVPRGIIGVATLSLKDMAREETPKADGSVELRGAWELTGILGLPSKEDTKKKDKKKKKDKPKLNSSRRDMSGDLSESGSLGPMTEEEDEEEEEPVEEEKPVSLGEISMKVAMRPPAARGGGAGGGGGEGGGEGGDGGDGGGEGGGTTTGEVMPDSMLELARLAVKRKEAFTHVKPKPDEGAGVGVESGRSSKVGPDGGDDGGAPAVVTGEPSGGGSPSPDAVSGTPVPGGEGKPPDDDDDDDLGDGAGMGGGGDVKTLSKMMMQTSSAPSVVYTFAFWIKWRPFDAIGDQMLFFGEPRNQPALIRGSKLGALVDNQFCATEYDPRLAGDNWQLLVVTNDGTYSKFYIGFSSVDDSGQPTPARAQEPNPKANSPADVRTEFDANIQIFRLKTDGKGAGLLAQSWIWPRDLTSEEVRELWMETKKRYPIAKRGLPHLGLGSGMAYRAPPSIGKKGGESARPSSSKKAGDLPPLQDGKGGKGKEQASQKMPWDLPDPIRDKDTAAMLEVPLAAKLAFQRLINVFDVLVQYAGYANSFIVIDRIYNMSCTAELCLELAIRRDPGIATSFTPIILVIDSRARLQEATRKLRALIDCGFLIDEEKEHGKHKKLLADDFAFGADLRFLVTRMGLAWLRASQQDLAQIESMCIYNGESMPNKVRKIYREHGDSTELQRDGRPKLQLIWKNFYQAQLYASGTHYFIIDEVEDKAKGILTAIGSVGSVFINGDTNTYGKIKGCLEDGSPLLLLESTGGVTQAFAYAFKAVRLLKSTWQIDYVMRLMTEYKWRAAREVDNKLWTEITQKEGTGKFKNLKLTNIKLLDKELARIDLLLASEAEAPEQWMLNFGLPEILLLFELYQRAPDYLRRQLHTKDVMKQNAEDLLDLYTECFSGGGGGIPELGLGSAEVKVVATAWNRHLLLYNNARIYAYRAWILQFLLYYLGFTSTSMSIFISNSPFLKGITFLNYIMLFLPIATALLGTISTRLRTKQKFTACKMASFGIVSEIYKFRVKGVEYDPNALAAMLAEKNKPKDKKKKDDNAIEVPISAKQRDKVSRELFVKRVSDIYTNCMNTELARGTSITHRSMFGIDPARLLRGSDTGPDESEAETREQLKGHVANRLYFLTIDEWGYGVDSEKQKRQEASRIFNKKIEFMITSIGKRILMIILGLVYKILELSIRISDKILGKLKGGLADAAKGPAFSMKPKPAAKAGGDEELGEDGNYKEPIDPTEAKINWLKEKWMIFFPAPEAAGSMTVAVVDEDTSAGEMLDETYVEDDEDAAPKGGAPAAGGGGKRIRDDFFGPLTIMDYMDYRAKPILAYFEKTAPWRGFWMQFVEILIFIFNALGAALVGMDTEEFPLVPFVALTVGIASILKSFLEFSSLEKQVEGYNSAINAIHNMLNKWESMTRTQRRTNATVKMVVSTVEDAMNLVAVAITDALPGGEDDEEGEGKEGEEKKEE